MALFGARMQKKGEIPHLLQGGRASLKNGRASLKNDQETLVCLRVRAGAKRVEFREFPLFAGIFTISICNAKNILQLS